MPFGSRAFPRLPSVPSGVRWEAPDPISCDGWFRSLSYTWCRLQRFRKLSDSVPPLTLRYRVCLPQASKVPFYVLRFPGYVRSPLCSHRASFDSAQSSITALLSVLSLLRRIKPGFAPATRLPSLLALRFCFKPETHMGFPAVHIPLLRPLRRASFAPFCLPSLHPKVLFWLACVAMTLVLFNFSKSSKRSSRLHHLGLLIRPHLKARNTLATQNRANHFICWMHSLSKMSVPIETPQVFHRLIPLQQSLCPASGLRYP